MQHLKGITIEDTAERVLRRSTAPSSFLLLHLSIYVDVRGLTPEDHLMKDYTGLRPVVPCLKRIAIISRRQRNVPSAPLDRSAIADLGLDNKARIQHHAIGEGGLDVFSPLHNVIALYVTRATDDEPIAKAPSYLLTLRSAGEPMGKFIPGRGAKR